MDELLAPLRAVIVAVLHALGITDRAIANPLVVGLAAFIIFGLLAIASLKIMLLRAQGRRERAMAEPTSTPAPGPRSLLPAVAWFGFLLAASILAALYANS